MTFPGGGQYDDVVRWLAEIDAQQAIAELRKLAAEADKTDKTVTRVNARWGQYGRETQKATQATQQQEKAMKSGGSAARGYGRSLDVVRIALGAITAMVVFRTIQFIEESMRKGIETAKAYETSLYRISNVERILSQAGLEVSVEGLRKAIQQLKEDLPIFSEADLTQQISLIGIMTKEFGLTEDKIYEVAKAIGVLNIRSGETEDLLTTTNKVLTALVAPSGRGIASLGLDFSEAAIKAMALKQGILEAGEGITDLTDKEKDLVKVAILLENTGQEFETINEFLETSTGLVAQQEEEWEDTLRMVGQVMLGLKAAFAPFAIGFLRWLQDGIQGLKAFMIILQAAKDGFIVFAGAIASFMTNPREFVRNFEGIKTGITDAMNDALEDGFKKFFTGQIPDDAPEWFKSLFGGFVENLDTPTAKVNEFGEAIENLEDVEGFEDLAEDLEKLQQKIEDTELDFQIDQAREFEDYQIEINRIIEDYAIKRRRIQEDMADKIADANQKHRNKELDDEARFQEQMRQLREKFLFNLEDALQERDARQVLRLQRQYEMDKQALINENALKQKEADRQHQEDLARIREERDDRLAELAEEERIRLQREAEDFALKQQRDAEDHAREMEQLRQQINERLMEFARAIGEEYNLNQEGVDAIYNLLQQYYGPGGYFDGLYDYSYDSMVARAQNMLASINMIVAQAQVSLNSLATPTGMIGSRIPSAPTRTPLNIGPQAQGGTYLATRPTSAVFGDVPEIATFTPIRKLGMTTSQAMMSGGGGMNGELGIEIILSPDLEARIVRKSQDMTAEVFTKITRSK